MQILNSVNSNPLREQNLEKFIDIFNQHTSTVSNSPTAHFIMAKSIRELNWVLHLQFVFQSCGYPVSLRKYNRETKSGKLRDYIDLTTSSSVQFYEIFKRFYKPNKIIPRDLYLSPDMVLHWYTGDGYYSKYQIYLYTNNFSKIEVENLSNSLESLLNISTHIQRFSDKRIPDSEYYIIIISSSENITNFLKFISKSNITSLSIAKSVFPWKFNCSYKRHYF